MVSVVLVVVLLLIGTFSFVLVLFFLELVGFVVFSLNLVDFLSCWLERGVDSVLSRSLGDDDVLFEFISLFTQENFFLFEESVGMEEYCVEDVLLVLVLFSMAGVCLCGKQGRMGPRAKRGTGGRERVESGSRKWQ